MKEHEGSGAAADALATFTEVIKDRDLRKSFAVEPEATLREAGANIEDIPDEVLGFLKGLSEEELDLLSRFNRELIKAGLFIKTPSGATVSWL